MKNLRIWILPLACLLAVGCAKKPASINASNTVDWPVDSPNAQNYHATLMQDRAVTKGDLAEAIKQTKRALTSDPKSTFLLTKLSTLEFESKLFEDSYAHANEALLVDKNYVPALRMRARNAMIKGDMQRAEETLGLILSKSHTDKSQDVISLAALYMENKKYNEATLLLKEHTANENPDVFALYYLGRVYAEQEKIDLALATYEKALQQNPQFGPALKAIALIYDYRGEKEKAITRFQDLLSVEPGNIAIRHHLAKMYLDDKKYKEAAVEYKKILEVAPSDANAQMKLGLVSLEQEDYDGAIVQLNGLAKKHPDLGMVRYYLGLAHEKKGNRDKALSEFLAIEGKDPVFVDARMAAAYVHVSQKQNDKAIKVVEAALGKGGDDVRLRAQLAKMLAKEEQYIQAKEVLLEGLKAQAKNEELMMVMAEVLEREKSYEEFEKYVRQVIDVNPDNATALNYLGYSFADRGINLDEAQILIERALSVKKNDGYITDSLGWVFYKKGDYVKATEVLEEAQRLIPNEPIILEHLGDVWLKRNDTKKAKSFYQLSIKHAEDKKDEKRVKDKLSKL